MVLDADEHGWRRKRRKNNSNHEGTKITKEIAFKKNTKKGIRGRGDGNGENRVDLCGMVDRFTGKPMEGLNFKVQGAGRAVVLVHGLASSLHEWDLLSPVLVGSGWRTAACDLLDHGDSPKEADSECCQLPAVYESLAVWIEGLNLEEPFGMVGHSLGGYLCLKFALEVPGRLSALVLIDPLFSPEQIPRPVVRAPQMLDLGHRMLHAAPGRMVEAMINRTLDPYAPMPAAVRRQKTHDLLRAAKQVTRLVRGVEVLTPRLGEIQVPALVIWGPRDRILKPESFPKLVAQMPNAKEVRMEACGHHPHLEKPEEVNEVIRGFLLAHG